MRTDGPTADPVARALMVTAVPTALTLLTALVVRRRCVLLDVSGPSMLPTYRDGDRLLAARVPLRLVRRGTVVVIRLRPAPGLSGSDGSAGDRPVPTSMVKRVAALPGEETPGLSSATDVVPPGHLFVLGDNREVSYDSRHTGPVPFARLAGVVLCRVRCA
ncbi:S26 family signal peptidase [Streptomyces netropsis]|uniref:S26 family signal peptidase n=1 Tax=Streptomyces netropsis TaxID=55404 RepID=UPI0037A1E17C